MSRYKSSQQSAVSYQEKLGIKVPALSTGKGFREGVNSRLTPLFMVIILVFITSACSNAPETPAPTQSSLPTLEPVDLPVSAWGNVELIAQAESREAPDFLALDDGAIVFSWTGAQENEARLYSRGVMGNGQIMTLKAFFPFEQELFTNPEGIMVLWLDRTAEEEDLRLQMGLFNRDGIATLGPGNVSTVRTQRYSAAKYDSYLYTVWSGGIGSVSNLYLQTIDSLLRPITQKDLRVDADYPALLNIEDELYLFWLEDNGRDVYTARFEDEALNSIRRITRTRLDGTIAIDDFSVGLEGEIVYLFWNLRYPDGSRQVLFSVGQAEEGDFSTPKPLGIRAADDASFDMPYVLTDIHGAELSEDNIVSWTKPASGAKEMLPVAVNLGEELGVAFFQEGELVAYQAVVQSGTLIGLPNLRIINKSHLALSWAQPSNRAYANLFFTRTQIP